MKKLIFFSGVVLFGMTMMVTSCSQDDDLVDPVVEEVSVDNKSAFLKSTSGALVQDTRTWSTVGGTATGWIRCYDAKNTNQTSKRSVFTVSNNSSSANSINVVVQITSNLCLNTPTQTVLEFAVPNGQTVTRVLSVSGYPVSQNRLRVQVRPLGYSGSYSGMITYGYEQ